MNLSGLMARATLLCAAWAFAPLPASAQLAYPFSATIGVEAFPVNTYLHPGVARNTTANGPVTDAVSELYGLNTADAAASVDAAGLHASAVVHGDPTHSGATGSARSWASLVNPFMIVPLSGFTGTRALLREPSTWLLMAAGLGCLARVRRRRPAAA